MMNHISTIFTPPHSAALMVYFQLFINFEVLFQQTFSSLYLICTLKTKDAGIESAFYKAFVKMNMHKEGTRVIP